MSGFIFIAGGACDINPTVPVDGSRIGVSESAEFPDRFARFRIETVKPSETAAGDHFSIDDTGR